MTDDNEALEPEAVGEIDRVLRERHPGAHAGSLLGQEPRRTRRDRQRRGSYHRAADAIAACIVALAAFLLVRRRWGRPVTAGPTHLQGYLDSLNVSCNVGRMRGAQSRALAVIASLLWPSVASTQDIPAPPLSKRARRPSAPVSDPQDVKDLKRTIARNPTAAAAWATLAWRYYRDGRYGEAQWLLGEARKLQSADLYTLWLSGLTAYRMRDFPQAKTFLWTLFTDQRPWPVSIYKDVAYDILGRLFLEEGKLFEAAFFFSKATDESPQTWQYHFLHGFTEWYRELYGEAYESLQSAIKLNSSDPMLLRYYALAKAAYDERWGKGEGRTRMEGAIDAARKSIAATPNDSDGYILLGKILGGLGGRDEAIQYLRGREGAAHELLEWHRREKTR